MKDENYIHPKKIEHQIRESERIRRIWEENKDKPYDPLNDPILQTELERERKLKVIGDKITETYNRKKAEGKLHELTNISYDGENDKEK